MTAPTMVILSLGAGIQSTTLPLLAAEGALPKLDAAIFADTGWEPRAVYDHLGRLEGVLAEAGVPVYRVSVGNIAAGALGLPDNGDHILHRPAGWFASMPLYIQRTPGPCRTCSGTRWWDGAACKSCKATGWDDGKGMLPRQCTSDYKLAAVKAQTRVLLGGSTSARVRKGVYAEAWVGFSTDEIGRVGRGSDVQYQKLRYPLLELGMSRKDCIRYLAANGWGDTPRSACIGCPLHGNATWRDLRNNRPDEWALAVAFDKALRENSVYTNGDTALDHDGLAYLHRSRVPLDLAPIDRVTSAEWRDRQGDLLDVLAEEGDPDGCSPYGCRSGAHA